MATSPRPPSRASLNKDSNGINKNLIPPKTAKQESVKVTVRCRPMSDKELEEGHKCIVNMFMDQGMIELVNPKYQPTSNTGPSQDKTNESGEEKKYFTFDAVFDPTSKQTDIYDEICRPIVDSVLDGFNGTIFAYGQTGTGKTFTMEGVRSDPDLRGVIPNAFEHIFNHIARSTNCQYLVRSSYLEIYQEEIRDLLAKDQTKRLELKERSDIGVYVKDLSSFVCKSIKEIEQVMSIGHQNRSVGATNMNEHSSRSHAIFIVTVEQSQLGIDGQNHIRVGKLNLVDLAGSERQAKTGAVGTRQKEAIKINLSLSALGNVISALVDGKSSHVPYRDSKLTRLLQDSLGGNAKTVMIANIGPASYNYEETLTTLRYANRAKNIKNKPRINEDPKDALLREFQQEIERLRKKLEEKKGGGEGRSRSTRPQSTDSAGSQESTDSGNMSVEQLQKLEAKIKAMESKLLEGGKNIIDHTNEQERELERRRQEIAEQRRKERQLKQQLEEQEDSTLNMRETYESLQQEVEAKRKKLRKLFNKLKSVQAETRDVQEANSRERQELDTLQTEQLKELKLKFLIIDNFIPIEEKNQLLSRIQPDEDVMDEDQWRVVPLIECEHLLIDKRPVATAGARRPITEYAKMAATIGSGWRYKSENILDPELDMPSRTTRDYSAPMLSPRIRAALETALKDEEDVELDASAILNEPNLLFGDARTRRKSAKSAKRGTRPRTSRSTSGATTPFAPLSHGPLYQKGLSLDSSGSVDDDRMPVVTSEAARLLAIHRK